MKKKLYYIVMINPFWLRDKLYYYFESEEKLEAFKTVALEDMKKHAKVKLTKKDLMTRSGFFEYDTAERFLKNTSEQIVAWRHPGEMYVEHTDYFCQSDSFEDS